MTADPESPKPDRPTSDPEAQALGQDQRAPLLLDTSRVDPAELARVLGAEQDEADEICLWIEGPDVASLEPLLETISSRREGLGLTVQLHGPQDLAHIEAVLVGLRPDRVVLGSDSQFESLHDIAKHQLDPRPEVSVAWIPSPDNWFDLLGTTRRAAGLGVRFHAQVLDDRGEFPLGRLNAPRLRAVLDHLASTWTWFASREDQPNGETIDQPRLRQELCQVVIEREHARDSEALTIPEPDHDLWLTGRTAASILGPLLSLQDADELHEFVQTRLLTDLDLSGLREAPWFRLLLQRTIRERPSAELRNALLAVYGCGDENGSERLPEAEIAELFTAEDRFAELAGLSWFVEGRHEWLDPERLTPRRAPFAIPEPSTPKVDEEGRRTPLVTVLVPSFKHGEFIEECLRSVLGQTFADFDLLVVDDRSPDDTVEKAQQIEDPRLEVRVNETNLGLGNSVSQALETIETPYIALLNSDDLFHPERLQRCVEALENDSSALLVATGLHLVDETGGEMTTENVGRLTDAPQIHDWIHWYASAQPQDAGPEELFGQLLQHNYLATSTNLVCRTDFLRAQEEGLRSLKYCLDWWMFLAAAAEHGLRYLPERLASYRLHRNNTVWFREGSRWSYYLEVNRVAARALRNALEHARTENDEATERVLRLVVEHVSSNTEVDGLGIVSNQLLGGFELEQASRTSVEVENQIRTLHEAAERRLRIHYATQDLQSEDQLGRLDHLAELEERDEQALRARAFRERCQFAEAEHERVRDQLTALQQELVPLRQELRARTNECRRNDEVSTRLRDQIEALNRGLPEEQQLEPRSETDAANEEPWLDVRRAAELVRRWSRRQTELFQAEQRSKREQHRLKEVVAGVREDLQATKASRKSLQGVVDQLAEEVRRTHEELVGLRKQEADQQARLAAQDAEIGRLGNVDALLEKAREAQRGQMETLQQSRSILAEVLTTDGGETPPVPELARRAAHEIEAAGERATQAQRQLEELRSELESQRSILRHTKRELDRVRTSTEWRIGFFLWRKLPLFAKTRRFTTKAFRKLQETSRRTMMIFKKLFRNRAPEPPVQVLAGSTSQFPVISHTFVYQELTAMHSMMGADVRLLHTQDGDRTALHSAFRYLDENRQLVTPDWDVHTGDYEYFRETRPEKVTSLIEALSQESGLPVEDLEQRFELRMAFTYARRAEAMGVDYVHSYFFYDQALCALVTSWMLDLPRGLSTYADHMMDDWPLKVVPLHLRNADVIVATSRRIRDELVGIGGEGIAAKVIVKPNGVDGARFVRIPRQAPNNRPLSMICMTRIEPKKGLLELADAIKQVKDRGVEVTAHIIGAPDAGVDSSENYAVELDRRIAEHGIAGEMVLHGRMLQDDMKPLLEQADCFVAPFVETESGDKDGIPTAILEGMSSGLPVVGTDAGSIPEIYDDGVEGFIVPQKNAQALAEAIIKMASDPDKVLSMGDAARKRFEQEFDIRATEPRLHERIRAAIAKRGSSVGA